jgi:Homeodomain-like domain
MGPEVWTSANFDCTVAAAVISGQAGPRSRSDRTDGVAGLADRSHAPKEHPRRIAADIEAVICELRRAHRLWGPRRLAFELAQNLRRCLD